VVVLALIAFSIAQGDLLCNPCQLGVQLVKDFANKPDEELLAMLLKQCDRLPEQARGPCKLALSLVGRNIIVYVRANLQQPNKAICHRFRLCRSPTEESQVLAMFTEEKQDTPLCAPCQLGVNLVKDYISKPDEELLRMLMSGCNALPEQLQAPCKMAITLVGGQMIAYIRSHLTETPREICARFRLCARQEQAVVVANGPLCTPCMLFINLVKDYLSQPDEQILRILLNGCEQLPEQFVAGCKMVVTLAGKSALDFVRSNLREEPRVLCARFRACNNEIEEKNPVRCVLKCLGSGWTIEKVLALVAKCKKDAKCYAREIGEDRAACVMGCF
jgi:hypothetical protein